MIASSDALPSKYLGAHVRAGYLVPSDPGDDELEMFHRFSEAAQRGDETAQRILSAMTLSAHQVTILAKNHDVNIRFVGNGSAYLWRGRFPSPFTCSCMKHLTAQAEDGDFLARRFVAWVAMKRLTNPDFEVIEARA